MKEGQVLRAVQGIPIPTEAIFRKPAEPVTKPAKVEGFVISASLSPYHLDASLPSRKGYVRCLACGADVWAPNSSRHRGVCAERHGPPSSPCRRRIRRRIRRRLEDTDVDMSTAQAASSASRAAAAANMAFEETLFRKLFCDEVMAEGQDGCLAQSDPL
jgi:hypothetical protein